LQKFLELPEFEVDTEYDLDCDHDAVVVIQKGCFAWEIETQEGSSEKSGQTQQSKNGPKEKRKKSKQKSEENGKSKSPTPEEENLTNANTKGDFVKLEDCLRGIDLEIKRGSLTGVCGLGNFELCTISPVVELCYRLNRHLCYSYLKQLAAEKALFSLPFLETWLNHLANF